MMNSIQSIYDEHLGKAFDDIKRLRNNHVKEDWENNLQDLYKERIFSFGGIEYDEYKFAIETSTVYAQQAALYILSKLLTIYGKTYGYDVECRVNKKGDIQDLVIIDNNGKRTLYLFKQFGLSHCLSSAELEYRKEDRKADDYYYVSFMWKYAYKEFFDYNEDENDFGRGVSRVSIKDLFDKYINHEEYDRFYKEITSFEKEVRDYIGLRVVKTLQPSTLYRFKRMVKNTLITFDYEAQIEDKLDSTQISLIRDQFINKEVYTSMLNNPDFSESFYTAEWLFDSYKYSGNIDYTIVVLGYYKAVEQLLYAYIKLHAGEGYYLKRKYFKDDHKYTHIKDDKEIYDKYVPINQENIDDERLNSTLDTMIKDFFCNKNGSKLVREDLDKETVFTYIKEVLESIKNKRNGNFHKHNIKEKEAENKVEEARNISILTSFLILGAYTLRDKDYRELKLIRSDKIPETQKLYEYINDHPHRMYYFDDDSETPYRMIVDAIYNKDGYCTFKNAQAFSVLTSEPFDINVEDLPIIKAGWIDLKHNPAKGGIRFSGPQFTIFENGVFCAPDAGEVPLY